MFEVVWIYWDIIMVYVGFRVCVVLELVLCFEVSINYIKFLEIGVLVVLNFVIFEVLISVVLEYIIKVMELYNVNG